MTHSRNFYTMVLYVLGFMLLWEWLRPLSEITYTGELHYFVLFVAISLFLYFIRCPWWLRLPIKAFFVFLFLHLIFSHRMISMVEWLPTLVADVMENGRRIWVGNWYNLTDLTRSLLFFILLWLMAYLLRYWLILRKKVFVFYFTTILYVTVLDTFTIYNGKYAIVRIIVIGFVLLGMLFFQRFIEEERLEERKGVFLKWSLPLAVLIMSSVMVGYISPKADPVWPDPVPFIKSAAENGRQQSNVASIGYSPDDTKLGGPFHGDDRVVFEVKTPSRQYWKVEVKDVYTGKGWTSSDRSDDELFESERELAYELAATKDEQIKEAVFDMQLPYSHIVRPYAATAIKGNEEGYFQYDPDLDKFTSFSENAEPVFLKTYAVSFKKTSYSMKEMRATTALPSHHSDLLEHFTQLPDSLPERVRELAMEITADKHNWFDQAKAIEQYFQAAQFTYDQTDVAIPKGDQDYVDQFLFETQRGYCDNFSTSMVTLLRSVGIPARWAKGYTAGNYYGTAGSDAQMYQVTNNEAHSWVEVYFPTEGWVPFEPTKGFYNPVTYSQDEEVERSTPAVQNPEEAKPETPQPIEEEKEEIKNEPKEYRHSISIWPKLNSVGNWLIFLSVCIVIISAAVWLTVQRRKWIPYVLIWMYRGKNEEETFAQAYHDLLIRLDRFGAKREQGQTLREYAKYIDQHLNTNEMSTLTEIYERSIYRGDSAANEWENVRKLWENLIKRTAG
ncbi:transglutaminaseTgpA domain-containing protein [Bacillus sp. FJAT-50079]|uniref:transglutaminase TgpA family protein n=1 Tax=Bacillus sp. FJAT-50079 TaxID=2833577 RepID=UPI001BC957F8|nr:transglutaminaseTgpA domain-containing protein [Bacillus sp. FJAT-50079]MBS4210363.1 DUF4129 domain-containing protein [Bacillus sp. FJAT-50079]